MARIPLQLAGRSLDTGGVVQYPSGSPLGAAMEGFGDALQQIAARRRALDEKQDAFDAAILDDEFRATLAQQETEALEKAPADGKGLHDQIYGELDLNTKKPLRPGLFDQLFDQFLERVPESQRQKWAAQRDTLRIRGSTRLAGVQHDKRVAYEAVEVAKAEDKFLNEIIQADPDDKAAFEQFKKAGANLIANMTDPLEREKAAYNWEQKSAKALVQAMLNKDPSQVRALLGMEPKSEGSATVGSVVDRIIGVESGGNTNAKNPRSSAAGLGQFIDSTWLKMVRTYRPDVAAGKSAAQIIALKTDPALSRQMTEAYTNENAEYLKNRGVQTTAGNLYLAHFAGPAGAVQVLKADPNASVASVLGQDKVRANPFLAGMTVRDLAAWADKKMGGAGGGNVAPDPRLAALSPDDRLGLANQADVEVGQRLAAERAAVAAEYASYKDRFELGVVDGSIRDEALILNDSLLKDGDKATLLRSLRAQNETAGQIQADLAALASGNLAVDPYSTDGKKRVDNLYSDYIKRNGQDEGGVVAAQIVSQTGAVPQPVVNSLRGGIDSRDPGTVAQALQLAQKFSAIDPAALSRREGGGEVQTAVDAFRHYTNQVGLTPNEAAKRLIDARDPEKAAARAALLKSKPVEDFIKKQAVEANVRNIFDPGIFGSDPALGTNPAEAAAMVGEYRSILEESLVDANGDQSLAKSLAAERFSRRYSPSDFTTAGPGVVSRFPPERTYSAGPDGTLNYVREQAFEVLREEGIEADQIYLEPYDKTEEDFLAGKAARYQLFYEKDGNLEWLNVPFYAIAPTGAAVFDENRARWEENKALKERIDKTLEGSGMQNNPIMGDDPNALR